MSEVELIADQIASGYREGAWPGVSVRAFFHGVSPVEGAAHPIAGAHRAWEIALHLDHTGRRSRAAGPAPRTRRTRAAPRAPAPPRGRAADPRSGGTPRHAPPPRRRSERRAPRSR